MSDASPSETPKSPRPKGLSRWSVGSMSVLQTILLAITAICANFLAGEHYARRDMSRDSDYTLSPATTRYLASPAVRNRKDPIRIILAFRRSMPLYEQVRAMCEEYSRNSDRHIILEALDPVRSPDRAQQVAAAYGISYRTDVAIIDARTAAETNAPDDDNRKSAHIRFVTSDNMVNYTVEQGQRKPSSFQGEDVLTAGLVSALEGAPRKIYFLEDKSSLEAEGSSSPRAFLTSTLLTQNIILEPIRLAGLAAIPEDAAGVAFIAPTYDFNDAELATLETYWNRPKSAIFCTVGGARETPPHLRAFLRAHGVTPRHDRIMTRKGDRTISTVRATFTNGMEFTRDLAEKSTVFEGASSSLEVRESADDLLNRRIQPYSLIQAAPEYWGETKFGSGKESFDPREDHPAPLSLAAAVVRGAASDDRFVSSTSRMVILSNTDFLQPNNRQEPNIDFLNSSMNWLVGREDLAGIGPHPIGTFKLPILDGQVSFVNRVNLFFLPAFALVIAAFVWSARRA